VNDAVADVRSVPELLASIGHGGQPDYLLFYGHQPPHDGGTGKGCLSQWWPASFTVDGQVYPSAEHYMMERKALLFGDEGTAAKIRDAPHPGAVKALGRQVQAFDEQRWVDERFGIVIAETLSSSARTPG
jgi:ribA/ribD-fused uncharacterized protein